MEMRSIMYIGSKSRKDDRPNGDPSRVWNGTGTVVDGIPPTQAARLASHTDEFLDVTGLETDDLRVLAGKYQAQCDERKRASRAAGLRGGITLELATVEQLEAELKRRRDNEDLRNTLASKQAKSNPAANLAADIGKKGMTDQQMLDQKMPDTLEAVFQAAAENPDLLNDEGMPTKAAIEEELGFQITDEDYERALGAHAPA